MYFRLRQKIFERSDHSMLLMFNVCIADHFFTRIPDNQHMRVLINIRGYAKQFLSSHLHFYRIRQMEEFDVPHARRIVLKFNSARTFR